MRVLLLYPLFPKSFWSFEKALALVDRKALLPPLCLVTVAALLPQEWEYKLADRNIRDITEEEWEWADLVILSAMIVQQEDFLALIREAKQRSKPVAVGGPYVTSLPGEAAAAGADYLIVDEGEITLPLFVEALKRGEKTGTFSANGEKADVTQTPIPRFDLLDRYAYDTMAIQFSRGCPFQCEFCDIIVLYGRKSRTKNPHQILAELDRLLELGFTQSVFLVDDNFIGNKRNVKLLLKELKIWQEKNGYPFRLMTEASVDLGQDPELLEMMVECNFYVVFLGIETPDEESLTLTKKFQNTRNSLSDSVQAITQAGMRVMAGFIIGFDGEKPGAGDRIVQFVENTSIPMAMFSMLQALPNTALWHRLQKEGRLNTKIANMNQTTLMNFIPTRPLEEIAREYIDGFWQLYDPQRYLDRTYRHFMMMGKPRNPVSRRRLNWPTIRAFLTICWRQGIVRPTRWKFWLYLATILRHNPRVLDHYLSVCGLFEHFNEYRTIVRDKIESKLAEYLAEQQRIEAYESEREESAVA